MATIRAYTTIVQSRKLAEILPLESADMCYRAYREEGGIPDYFATLCPYLLASWVGVPCWSLTALLGVLPKNLNIGRPSLESNYKGYHWIQYYDEFMKPNNYRTECFNNPIDACYEMILKLHKLNLL